MAKSISESLEIRGALTERIGYELEDMESGGTDVYFFLQPSSADETPRRWLMMHVAPDMLTIYPFKDTETGYDSKYKGVKCIHVHQRRFGPYKKPLDQYDVDYLLGNLPEGLEQNPLNGLGFASQDRFIPNALSAISRGVTIVVGGGNEPPYMLDSLCVISENYLKRLTRGMRSISSKYQRQARTDKLIFSHNQLLSIINPDKFPLKQKKINAEAVFELVKVGRVGASVPKSTHRGITKLVGENVGDIAKNSPEALYELAAKIETATLQQMIEKYEANLGKNFTEPKWQAFFEAHAFILSLAFAVPTVFVQATPYVHGKRIDGQGGRFSDFLMRGQETGNAALIEIKTPRTPLLTTYRAEQQTASTELTGAITQVLGQRLRLSTAWHTLKGNDNGILKDTTLYSPQAVVLIGTLPDSNPDREVFEAFRSVLKDVTVITYSELLLRLKYLHDTLSLPSQEQLPLPPLPSSSDAADDESDAPT